MTGLLEATLDGAIEHPVYAVLLIAGVAGTIAAWLANRSFNKALRRFDASAPDAQRSNVRVLYPDAS